MLLQVNRFECAGVRREQFAVPVSDPLGKLQYYTVQQFQLAGNWAPVAMSNGKSSRTVPETGRSGLVRSG